MRVTRSLIGAFAVALTMAGSGLRAQTVYPNHAVTIVVPVQAGGVTDQMARVFAESLRTTLGQPIIVENKGGANGVIGANYVAKAAPDGYTLCFCFSGPLVLAQFAMDKLPFNPEKDLQPVSRVYDLSPIIVVPKDSKIASVPELIATARAKPGMSYGHTGNGGALHLGFAQLLIRAGNVEMTPVAYAGESPMLPDLISGRLDVGLMSALVAKAQAEGGKLKMVASLGDASPIASVPTVASQGFPGFSAVTWSGFFLPAGVPAPIANKIYDAVQAAVRSAAVRERITAAGLTPVVGQTPAQFAEFIDKDRQQWAGTIRKIGGIGK